jgi:ribosomal-protein-alanine N-acetyltransferase
MMVAVPKLVGPAVPAGRLSSIAQPTVAVDELLVRPWRVSDAPAVVAAYRDPGIRRWHVRSMTDEEALAWLLSWADRWAAETGAGWAVEADRVVVGRVGLSTVDLVEGDAAAGYWVLPQARGRDIAPRALRAVTEWMFTHVGLHRIHLEHSTRNEASCRVAVKARFVLEGTKRSSVLHADGWHDMHLHARVNAGSRLSVCRPTSC